MAWMLTILGFLILWIFISAALVKLKVSKDINNAGRVSVILAMFLLVLISFAIRFL